MTFSSEHDAPCPFGALLQKYCDRLSEQERRMKLDAQALYALVIQEMALHTAAVTPGDEIVDAFCGAGGSAIGFARAGKRVTAIELNGERLEMARHNAALFGVADRITFIHGDSLQLVSTLVHIRPVGRRALRVACRIETKMNSVCITQHGAQECAPSLITGRDM